MKRTLSMLRGGNSCSHVCRWMQKENGIKPDAVGLLVNRPGCRRNRVRERTKTSLGKVRGVVEN